MSQHLGGDVVSAGPIRLVVVVVVTFLSVFIAYRAGLTRSLRTLGIDTSTKAALPWIVWVMALDFDLRGATEPVLVPYYLVPVFICGLMACAMRSDRITRLAAGIVVAGATAWVSELHSIGEYPYLILVVLGLAILAALGVPRRAGRPDVADGALTAEHAHLPKVAAPVG